MNAAWGLFLIVGYYPFYRAWRGAAGTTLRHAIFWGALAWTAWCAAVGRGDGKSLRYLALCLTACAGVAVLGARRPGAMAWNFVVAGLLAALCRPLLEGLGELRLETGHLIILGVVLAVGLLNYLPTRQALPVSMLGAWCAVELAGVRIPADTVLLALAPWLALLCAPRQVDDDVDSIWRVYRDRFGFLWAQRLRDQFNRAAANAGWAVTLGWSGLRLDETSELPDRAHLLATLRALMSRFRTDSAV